MEVKLGLMGVRKITIISLFLPGVILLGAPQDEVTLLRWAGPPGSRPGTFKEWIASHPYTNFSVRLNKKVIGSHKGRTVTILIDSTIASSLTNEIDQLMADLQQEGYTVSSYKVSGGTPESLRSFLQGLYNTENIEGALLIGTLPVAWFQIKNDHAVYGYAEWPTDLFYMDLNGNWVDTLKYDPVDTLILGQDSIYDAHSGDLSPEIYIGRLMPTGIGNDTLLLKNYFSKNAAYRSTTIELQRRALVYVDDDWTYWATIWARNVSMLYSDTLVVSDSNTTRASDYKVRLDTARAWVSVFVHSWPGGHGFYYNDHTSIDYYYSTEYTTQNPPSNFYNFFACSFARYTENGYGAGRAIFNQSYGIGAIGSTKTGSMLEFYYFYLPLSQGKTIGNAFKDWFTHIVSDGVTSSELSWYYGMTLLGDPFLKPTGHPPGVPSLISPDSGFATKDTIVKFVWHSVSGADTYRIKIDNDSIETTDTIYIDTLTEGFHQWCVRAGNNGNWSEYSNSWKLIVDTTAPYITRVFPPADTLITDSVVTIQIKYSDTLSGIDTTEVVVVLDGNTVAVIATDSMVSYTPTMLTDTTHSVTVSIKDNAGNFISTSWSFGIDAHAPAIPTLIQPIDGVWQDSLSVHFEWTKVTKGISVGQNFISAKLDKRVSPVKNTKVYYIIQIDTTSSFTTAMITDTIVDTSYKIITLFEDYFYWRVMAYDSAGNQGEWTSVDSFGIDTTSPSIDSTTIWENIIAFWGPFEVKTKITDNAEFNNPVLFYRTTADPNWIADTMTSIGGGWYVDSIPEQTPQDSLRIDYYLTVEDFASNNSRVPDSGSYSFIIHLTGVEDHERVPDKFVLFPPIPNPSLNSSVIIKYGLPKKTNISLSLYDISGRLVQTIYSGTQEKGYYAINIRNKELRKGIYFIKFESNAFTSTKKLIILE